MDMDIRASHLRLDGDLRAFAERRFDFALARFGPLIRRVFVRLSDLNGPRGGEDQYCRVIVGLRPRGRLIVGEVDVDVHAAISRVADRLGRLVARELDRRRENRNAAAWCRLLGGGGTAGWHIRPSFG